MSHPLVTVIGTLLITSLVLAVLVGLAAAAVMMSRGPRTALGLALPVPPGSRPFFGRPSLPKRWELMPRIAAIDRTSATPAASAHQDPRKRGGPLERITVNLVLRAARALQMVSALTGDSKTDCINRAIQVYAYLVEIGSHGGAVYVREDKDSELQLLKIL
jgi:hypothetical protein